MPHTSIFAQQKLSLAWPGQYICTGVRMKRVKGSCKSLKAMIYVRLRIQMRLNLCNFYMWTDFGLFRFRFETSAGFSWSFTIRASGVAKDIAFDRLCLEIVCIIPVLCSWDIAVILFIFSIGMVKLLLLGKLHEFHPGNRHSFNPSERMANLNYRVCWIIFSECFKKLLNIFSYIFFYLKVQSG